MPNRPFTFGISLPEGIPTEFDTYIARKLSAMEGQYTDGESYRALLAKEDTVIYEVYEISRPEVTGELRHGLSIVHPGKVGNEYFMTKGHFHRILETAEVYYCLKGAGMMIMETPEGEWSVQELSSGKVLYVPPRWGHRLVNIGRQEDLVTFFIYPAQAGHDYGTIEAQGFRKLVIEQDNQPRIVDNPRWLKK